MNNKKYKAWRLEIVWFLLLWYIPFCISAAGDKYFDLPSCVMINWVRMFHPQFAVWALALVTIVYFSSFAYRRFHIAICVLLCADGLLGLIWLTNRIHFLYGWEDIIGFRAYFWKPFFDAIGLELKEEYLFNWGTFAGKVFPFVICSYNFIFMKAAYKNWTLNESKKGIFRQLREWRKHKLVLAAIFILLSIISFYHVKRLEREQQEFLRALKSARNGHGPFMTSVGRRYWWGDGTEHNSPEAIRWLEKAAQNGDTDAMSFLGKIYYAGYRTGRDWGKAKCWLTAFIKTNPEYPDYALYILNRIDNGLLPFSVDMDSLRVGKH